MIVLCDRLAPGGHRGPDAGGVHALVAFEVRCDDLLYPVSRGSGVRPFPEDAPSKLVLAASEAYEHGAVHRAQVGGDPGTR